MTRLRRSKRFTGTLTGFVAFVALPFEAKSPESDTGTMETS